MKNILIGVLVWLALFSGGALGQSDVQVQLVEEAELTGTEITLGDIAELSGPPQMVEKLAAVFVGRAPLPGSTRRLTLGQITVRLRQADIDPAAIDFGPNHEVIVTGQLSKDIRPRNDQPIEEPDRSDASRVVELAVATARDIARGEILTEDDLTLTEPGGRRLGSSDRLEEFTGLQAVRNLREGTILTRTAVEVPPVIERGDRVTIIAVYGSVEVTAPGVARDRGGVGEVISVENISSNQVVQAEIVDSEKVRVILRGGN